MYNVSIEAEIPEPLHLGMKEILKDHPRWSADELVTQAIASFLAQNLSHSSPSWKEISQTPLAVTFPLLKQEVAA